MKIHIILEVNNRLETEVLECPAIQNKHRLHLEAQ